MEILDEQIATSIIKKCGQGDVPVPTNILKNSSLFLHGAIDNDDFNEETLDGKKTTHITAMVLYQTAHSTDESNYIPESAPANTLGKNSFCTLPCQMIQKCDATNKTPNLVSTTYFQSNISEDETDISHFLWILCRISHSVDGVNIYPHSAVFPGWTPFHQCITNSDQPLTKVGFCTTLPAPPTNIDTVNTALRNFLNLNSQIGKRYSVLSCDMAIYLIAKKIQLQQNEFDNLYLRIGGFHVVKNWLTVLGQYLSGSGAHDIMVESGLYGENTIQAILKGMQYNRGVRAHKLLYEALRRIQFHHFLRQEEGSCEYSELVETIQTFQNKIFVEQSECAAYYDLLAENSPKLAQKFGNFLKSNSEKSETYKFWSNYCSMVELMLDCIRADRDGLWQLHLETINRMVPYFFVFNHTNYIRGCILYLQDMAHLPQELLNDFKQGYFSVKRSEGKFNSVATDHALEQSLIRSSKIQGGVIGITANLNALQKWMLLYQSKTSMNTVLERFVNLSSDITSDIDITCNEWGKERISRDESDVQRLISFIKNHDDPFQLSDVAAEGLRNIVSGVVASAEVAKFLLNVRSDGKQLYSEFLAERIFTHTKNIFSPIPRLKQKTFTYVPPMQKMSLNKKTDFATDNLTFTYMLAGQRGFSVKELLKYELSTYPSALATHDGFLKKSVKSELMNEIERSSNCSKDMNDVKEKNQIHIVDGMALIHSVPSTLISKMEKFEDFATFILQKIVHLLQNPNCKKVELVFDRYDIKSIKTMELERRQRNSEPLIIRIYNELTQLPKQWQRFLNSNKQELIKFLSDYILKKVHVPKNKSLVLACGFEDSSTCVEKDENQCIAEVTGLKSNHVEADTRIFLHAYRASLINFSKVAIFIHSPDTDVFVLGIRFWKELQSVGTSALWIQVGVGDKRRYLGCHLVNDHYSADFCQLIPALHAFTGCDTTSKIGTKKAALKLMTEPNSIIQTSMKSISNLKFEADDLRILEQCYLKLIRKSGINCDESRYSIFTSKPKCVGDMSTLPCTSDAFRQHVLRAGAQTYIWENSLKPIIAELDYEKFGYELDKSGYLETKIHHFSATASQFTASM